MNLTETDKNIKENFKKVLLFSLFIFGIIFFLKTFVLDFFLIPSDSMKNTLLPGDYVVVSRLNYDFGIPRRIPFFNFETNGDLRFRIKDFKRGDLAVIYKPDATESRYIIKRIIALPGDSVAFRRNTIFVNGRELRRSKKLKQANKGNLEAYLIPGKDISVQINNENIDFYKNIIVSDGKIVSQRGSDILIDGAAREAYTFSKNYYFVVGDNLPVSKDSRRIGPVAEQNIEGRPLFIWWSADGGDIRFDRIFKSIN